VDHFLRRSVLLAVAAHRSLWIRMAAIIMAYI